MENIRVEVGARYANIPIEEYKELLLKSLRIDLLCDMVETENFITKKDLMLALGMKQKEDGESV